MAETNAFRKTVEGVPLGQLTVGEILELRNSGRGHDDLLTFADSPSDDGTVATRDRGSESYQFVYFFSDEALRWSPNALGPTFFGVFFDVYLSKALKRPKDEIKRLRQE